MLPELNSDTFIDETNSSAESIFRTAAHYARRSMRENGIDPACLDCPNFCQDNQTVNDPQDAVRVDGFIETAVQLTYNMNGLKTNEQIRTGTK